MEAPIYNATGKKTGTINLPEHIFGMPWNDSLMHQVVTSMQDNARQPVANVKGRGEVRGGGRKPWQQKGTGRARHGSIRSPIWRGGGVTHGPSNEKKYARRVPKKLRARALAMALSRKLHDGEILFVDSFGIDAPKTAVARKALVSLGNELDLKKIYDRKANATLIALADPREASLKSFRNIGNIECKAVRELNPVSVLKHGYVVIENPSAAVSILSHRIMGKESGERAVENTRRVRRSEKSVHEIEKGDQ